MAVLSSKQFAGVAVADRQRKKAEAKSQHDDIQHETLLAKLVDGTAWHSANGAGSSPGTELIGQTARCHFRHMVSRGTAP